MEILGQLGMALAFGLGATGSALGVGAAGRAAAGRAPRAAGEARSPIIMAAADRIRNGALMGTTLTDRIPRCNPRVPRTGPYPPRRRMRTGR